jgi:para-aminobenzoate synthetase/4-amino-4-deoxychorismate lyase
MLQLARYVVPVVTGLRADKNTTVTRGALRGAGTIVIAARAFEPAPPAGVVLSIEPRFRLAGDAIERHKTTSRARHALAREEARRAGAFDALLCHVDGDIADATSANVWARVDGELVTPPIERGALPGIVRAVLIEELARERERVRERALEPGDLARSEEIFLSNSVQRVVAVSAITGLVDGLPGSRGPCASRALARVLAAERRRS